MTPQPHPLLALLGRYAAVFNACWQARHELAGPRRLADERAFLPAALSLQETPPHPAPRRAAIAIGALIVLALAWACLGELDVVAVAQGRVIVGERTKLIQPLETAMVRAIHVRDGDQVEAGQLLVELDPTAQHADATRVGEERHAALSDALRAEALLSAGTSGVEARLAAPRRSESESWKSQDQAATHTQLQAEWQDHRAKLAKLAAEQARRSAELGTASEVLAKLQATVPLARQREADVKQLADQGFMSGHAGQDRTRERIELERDLATAQARVTEAQAAVAESQRGQAAYLAEARRTWQDRAAQARLKLAELTQEHTKAAQRSRQTRLTAPVAGTVQQLAIHTPGGVVTPAQALMVIVPNNGADGLIAEVSIENKDIGFVQAGQHAEVKLETFNFTRYGTVPATVQWVTADAVVQPVAAGNGKDDEGTSAKATQAVFPARLVLARGDIAIDGKTVHLSPGLNLTAEIKTGKRRVIDYLLSPVQKRVGESLRER
ncbi:MAG: HlyD family type I secretion periplasmic adaptor subunit [Burkholderiales bacterium]